MFICSLILLNDAGREVFEQWSVYVTQIMIYRNAGRAGAVTQQTEQEKRLYRDSWWLTDLMRLSISKWEKILRHYNKLRYLRLRNSTTTASSMLHDRSVNRNFFYYPSESLLEPAIFFNITASWLIYDYQDGTTNTTTPPIEIQYYCTRQMLHNKITLSRLGNISDTYHIHYTLHGRNRRNVIGFFRRLFTSQITLCHNSLVTD